MKSKRRREEKEREDRKDFSLIERAYRKRGIPKGARQIKMYLESEGIRMNLKKIRRLMRKFNLMCPIRNANPRRRMIMSMKESQIFSNRLNRIFDADYPGRHLLTDITYIKYGDNKTCYLSAVKDASTKEILAAELSTSLRIEFILKTLDRALSLPFIQPDVLVHSDQGSHYTSREFIAKLKEFNASQSLSRRGNCWDNAPMESFFGHLKDEIRFADLKTFCEVRRRLDDYITYYNTERRQWGMGRMTPVQKREALLARGPWSIVLIS